MIRKPRSRTFTVDTRAVSDTIGYVMLIAIVFFAVILVTVMAGPVLEAQQESEYMHNTERAFEVFGDNLDAIDRDSAPARATEIRYRGGTIFSGESTRINVSITTNDGTESFEYNSFPVQYEASAGTIVYESGAVIREDEGGTSLMTKEPSFAFSEDRVRMSVIRATVVEDVTRLDQTGKITLVARELSSGTDLTSKAAPGDDITVEITVESPYYEAWDAYFDEQGLTQTNINHDNGTVTYEISTDEVFLRNTHIRIEGEF